MVASSGFAYCLHMFTPKRASGGPCGGYSDNVPAPRPTAVLIVDGNRRLAEVMADLLADEPGFAVAGLVDTAEQAVRVVQSGQVDVVLVDERLVDIPGSAALPTLRAAAPSAALLLWSHDVGRSDEHLRADGLLPRGLTFRELVYEIRRVLRNRSLQHEISRTS